MKRLMGRGDAVIVIAVLLLALGLLLPRLLAGQGRRAEVYADGVLIEEIDLARAPDGAIEIPGGRLEFRGGALRYAWADCPDQCCVRFGWLRRAGESAACVPNRTLVVISGAAADGEADAVTY